MLYYLMSHSRHPVTDRMLPGDPQARIPFGWCGRCGQEVYRKNAELCRRCQEMEEKGHEKLPQ